MRRIEKGPEATCLSVVRREAARLQGATGKALQAEDWAIVTTEQKQELRDCLLRDQGRGLNPHPEQCFQPTRTGALQAKGPWQRSTSRH